MAREFLRLTPEATWGTFDATSTSAILVDIDQSNNYTVRPQPIKYNIRTAGIGNRRLQTGSNKTAVGGNLDMLVHGSQGAVLAPWVYSSDNATIGSMTIDHCIQMEDGGSTKIYSRDLGVMVQQAQFTASEQDQLLRLQLQLVGKNRSNSITATDFPEPAPSDYATDALYVFEHASGGLTVASSRMDFETFQLTIKNMLDVRFFVGATAQKIKYCGRDVDWTSRLSYSSNTPRLDLEGVTGVSGAITFTNGSHHLIFNMESKNFFAQVEDDLALDKVFLQTITMESYVDPSPGTDLSFTAN
jgi:hypothetical protein